MKNKKIIFKKQKFNRGLFENQEPPFSDIKVFLRTNSLPKGQSHWLIRSLRKLYSFKLQNQLDSESFCKQICSADLSVEIHNIKIFPSWRGFPNSIRNLILNVL